MKATHRDMLITCAECRDTHAHGVVVTVGAQALCLCERCAARLVRLLTRAKTRTTHA